MSKKSETEVSKKDVSEVESTHVESQTQSKSKQLKDLEQRLSRIEKRTKNNERFARTLSGCLETQVIANDAIVEIVRRALREDAVLHDELSSAIREYDRHKIRRWFSGFLGAIFRIAALASAGFMGAFIYWVFSGK